MTLPVTLEMSVKKVAILTQLSRGLTRFTAWGGALALLVNVVVVFASVVWRYALHSPIEWAEEVARALMVTLVFFGVATSTGRGRHIGVDLFLRWLPEATRPYVVHASRWVLVLVALGLTVSSFSLVGISLPQTTEHGLPQAIFVVPVFILSLIHI